MSNIKSSITRHNSRIIRKSKTQTNQTDNCNCRDKERCPLQNQCMTKDIVYKAEITTNNSITTKYYIGMTANTFKERYRNHVKSFQHKKYANETELSKYIWTLKNNNHNFTIKWSVLKHAFSYTGGSKRCNLCLEEKFSILNEKRKKDLLNKKSEIVSACPHKNKFRVSNLKRLTPTHPLFVP